MKLFKYHTLLLCCIVLSTELAIGQDIQFSESLKVISTEKISAEIKKDAELLIYGLTWSYNDGFPTVQVNAKTIDGIQANFDSKRIDKFNFKDIDTRDKVWNKNLLLNGSLVNLLTKGYQYSTREELNSEAIEYINTLQNYDRFYHEEYFEDYLYTLINKIHDGILKDKRPGNIFLKIIKDPEPNAFTLPNGCIIISTGLLSTIQSEDELVGVLSHEIAHFVLDHQILNLNQAVDRKKKAEFWATFATVVAASADAYLAVNNKNYIPGILTASTAIGATIISKEVTQRLGINYSQQQEAEADNAAKEILGILNFDKSALSVALYRIKTYCIMTGKFLALYGSDSHPSLDSRITSLGLPDNFDNFSQSKYLKKVSFINSYNAWIELDYYAHHLTANELVSRNINNNVATEIDYIIKAVIKRRLSNTKESNEEVISLLNTAKILNVNPPLMLFKEEAISLLRLDRKEDAKKSLQNYLTSLLDIKEKNEIREIKNYNKALEEEISWTKKMIFKIDSL
jgi:beta-barrel assembly-enhancing protease